MGSVRPSRDRIVALLGYGAILLAIVVGIIVLSFVIGDRFGIGRIVWFALGAIVGALWGLRSRLPILSAADTPGAAVGWVGLILAGVITLAALPSSTLTSQPSASDSSQSASSQAGESALRPAPPTAVRRTGTLTPVAASAKPATGSTPSPGPAAGSPVPRRSPSPATVAKPALLPPGFDPNRYLGQGNLYECSSFDSQAEAQAVLRADPTDPNVIDRNRDGLACEDNPPPRDTERVPRP